MSDFQARIDLHGMDSERATAEILRLIERAQATGTMRIEIVHGRGKGILANLVREVLKANPRISDIGALDNNAGGGVWARVKKISDMPRPAAPVQGSNTRAQLARDLLKQAKRLDLPGS